MRKKILILGATGFIGRNVAEYFAGMQDVDVYGTYYKSAPLNHPQIQMIQADLRSSADVDNVIKGMDVVIQAAAVTSAQRTLLLIGSTYCRQCGDKFAHLQIGI